MSPDTPPAPPFPVGRSIATMLVGIGVGLAVAVAVLLLIGASDQLVPAAAGAAVATIAGVLALLPMRLADRAPLETAMTLALLGTGIRLVGTIAGLVVLVFGVGLDRQAAGLWTLGWYALLLGVEARTLARYFQSLNHAGPTGPPAQRRDTTDENSTASKLVEDRPC